MATPLPSHDAPYPNPDLVRERSGASFDASLVTNFLDGGRPDLTARRRFIEAAVLSDPSGIFDHTTDPYVDRNTRHVRALGRMVRLSDLARRLKVKDEVEFQWLVDAVGDDLPTALHWVMFVPNIESLCDEEQRKYWLPRCKHLEVIGCYAQTELGHGSNVRALETTATYDKETDEFVLHTPSLTGSKFWPGTLGRTANCAMVIAQLVDGEGIHRGVHNFLVPLRDPETHLPLPGVTVGDIGPKIGYNNMDNGFASFDKVRVPRRNMAARFSKVLPGSGKYVAAKVSEATRRIHYITMMYVRAHISHESGKNLARGITIAVRYSCVRRQGFVGDTDEERQVMDYLTQQQTLLPLLASAYALRFAGRRVLDRLRHTEAALLRQAEGGGSAADAVPKERVSDLHASTSCLKSFCSGLTADGLEKARKCCGGHGFLVSSGLPELIGTYLQNPTVEGDNAMLHQQTVRVLLKVLPVASARAKGSRQTHVWEDADCTYLVDGCADLLAGKMPTVPEDLLDLDGLCAVHRGRACRLLLQVGGALRTAERAKVPPEEAWNESLPAMAAASTAHATALVLDTFRKVLEEAERGSSCLGPQEVASLRNLAVLFGIWRMEATMADFLEGGAMGPERAPEVRVALREALRKVRPDAVALADAWDFSDFRLKSALGRYDGDVYPAIIEASRRDPLNATEPGPGYREHLRGMILEGRRRRQEEEAAKKDKGQVKGVTGTVARL